MNAPLADPIMGLDEDWSKVDPRTAAAQGFHFVVGYISQDHTGKNITRSQIDALHAAGLDVALVFEYNPESARGGAYAGTQDATIAVRCAQQLGAPRGMTIYYAIDYNARSATEMAEITRYRVAAQAVTRAAGYEIGTYGGYYVCSFLAAHAFDGFLWQTSAWSSGQWEPSAVLRQVQNGIHVGSATVDRDEAMRPNFGQWRPDGSVGNGAPMGFMDDGDAAALAWRMDALESGAPTVRNGPYAGEPMWAVAILKAIDAQTRANGEGISAIHSMLADLLTRIPAPAPTPTPTPASGPEQQLLDIWQHIATALDSISISMGSRTLATLALAAHPLAQATGIMKPSDDIQGGPGPAQEDVAQGDSLPFDEDQVATQPAQEPATASSGPPVDSQP